MRCGLLGRKLGHSYSPQIHAKLGTYSYSLFEKEPGLEAYGVCFLAGERMTPLVKVPEAGTLVFEGSCGSGTLASAIALSRGCDGDFSVALRQPAGTVYASVTRQAGAVTAASIGGSVALEAPITVAI